MELKETDPLEIRCRRLGHEVPFSYCCSENAEQKPCRLILDCWWERFDVEACLRERLSPEEFATLEHSCAAPPPDKTVSLIELIEQARARLTRPPSSSE